MSQQFYQLQGNFKDVLMRQGDYFKELLNNKAHVLVKKFPDPPKNLPSNVTKQLNLDSFFTEVDILLQETKSNEVISDPFTSRLQTIATLKEQHKDNEAQNYLKDLKEIIESWKKHHDTHKQFRLDVHREQHIKIDEHSIQSNAAGIIGLLNNDMDIDYTQGGLTGRAITGLLRTLLIGPSDSSWLQDSGVDPEQYTNHVHILGFSYVNQQGVVSGLSIGYCDVIPGKPFWYIFQVDNSYADVKDKTWNLLLSQNFVDLTLEDKTHPLAPHFEPGFFSKDNIRGLPQVQQENLMRAFIDLPPQIQTLIQPIIEGDNPESIIKAIKKVERIYDYLGSAPDQSIDTHDSNAIDAKEISYLLGHNTVQPSRLMKNPEDSITQSLKEIKEQYISPINEIVSLIDDYEKNYSEAHHDLDIFKAKKAEYKKKLDDLKKNFFEINLPYWKEIIQNKKLEFERLANVQEESIGDGSDQKVLKPQNPHAGKLPSEKREAFADWLEKFKTRAGSVWEEILKFDTPELSEEESTRLTQQFDAFKETTIELNLNMKAEVENASQLQVGFPDVSQNQGETLLNAIEAYISKNTEIKQLIDEYIQRNPNSPDIAQFQARKLQYQNHLDQFKEDFLKYCLTQWAGIIEDKKQKALKSDANKSPLEKKLAFNTWLDGFNSQTKQDFELILNHKGFPDLDQQSQLSLRANHKQLFSDKKLDASTKYPYNREGYKRYFSYGDSEKMRQEAVYKKLLSRPKIKAYIGNSDKGKKRQVMIGRDVPHVVDVVTDPYENRKKLVDKLKKIATDGKLTKKPGEEISLKAFFKKFGIEDGDTLYHDAGTEEVNSSEFREAFVLNAFNSFKGDPGSEFNVIPIGGASGVGKTTSAKKYVIKTFCESATKKEEFLLPFIDGGIPRDICNVKKMLIEAAEKKGYIITDLHKQTKKFLDSDMKKDLNDMVFNMTEQERREAEIKGVVVVDTFSEKSKVKKLVKNLDKLKKQGSRFKTHMVMVGGENPATNFQNVRAMGDYRANPSKKDLQVRQSKDMEDQAHKIKTKEYKKYEKVGYTSGVLGSWHAFATLKKYSDKHHKELLLTTIDNTVKLYKQDGTPYDTSSSDAPLICLELQAIEAEKLKNDNSALSFQEALNEVRQDPKFQPPIHSINLNLDWVKPPFKGLAELLVEKTQDFGVISKAIGTIITQQAKSPIEIADWPEKNVPFIVEALKIGTEVDFDNIESLKKAQQGLQGILEKMDEKDSSLESRRKTKHKLMTVLEEVNERLTELEIQKTEKGIDVIIPSKSGFEHKITSSDKTEAVENRSYVLKTQSVEGFSRPLVYFQASKKQESHEIYDMIEIALANWKPGHQFFISATNSQDAETMLYALSDCLEKFKKHNLKYEDFKIQDIIIKSNDKAVRNLNIQEELKKIPDLVHKNRLDKWPDKGELHYKSLLKIDEQPEYKTLIDAVKSYFTVWLKINSIASPEKEDTKKFMDSFKQRKAVLDLIKKNPQLKDVLDNAYEIAKIIKPGSSKP